MVMYNLMILMLIENVRVEVTLQISSFFIFEKLSSNLRLFLCSSLLQNSTQLLNVGEQKHPE